MKTKNVKQKLTLNKTTISQLNNKELESVVGGLTIEFTECRTGCVSFCPICETERGRLCEV